jgi:hypothetical protein
VKNRLCHVCGALLVAAAGVLLWWLAWEPPEPVYDGKPLSYWLTKVNFATGYLPPLPRRLLVDSNAVPFLTQAVKRDSWFGAAFYRNEVWARLPLAIQKHLPHADRPEAHTRRMMAANILWRMGPVATSAGPALVTALKHDNAWDVRYYAAQALGSLGKGDSAVTGALGEALNDKDRGVRIASTNALLKLDPEAAAKAGIKPPSR